MESNDYEVRRKVWESQVAVQFTLLSDDPILPFYTMLPRCSYLPIVLPKVLNFFANREGVDKIDAEKVCLEANGDSLKMYLPIGVLYDLHNFDSDGTWNITVRTRNVPEGYLMMNRDSMESVFMQNIKEADYLKRKAETTNKMQKEEHKQLWNGVVNHNFADFWNVNNKLMDTSEKPFDNIPLRVYVKGKPFLQKLIGAYDEDNSLRTIGSATAELLKEKQENIKILVSHGVEIPPETPLIFAAQNLSYPDNFVHVVVH